MYKFTLVRCVVQRAAIKKQFFLSSFNHTPPTDSFSFGRISVLLATSLSNPLPATNMTTKVWLEFKSDSALDIQQPVTRTASGTLLAEVRFVRKPG
jgi:hypothetical protein